MFWVQVKQSISFLFSRVFITIISHTLYILHSTVCEWKYLGKVRLKTNLKLRTKQIAYNWFISLKWNFVIFSLTEFVEFFAKTNERRAYKLKKINVIYFSSIQASKHPPITTCQRNLWFLWFLPITTTNMNSSTYMIKTRRFVQMLLSLVDVFVNVSAFSLKRFVLSNARTLGS